MQEVNALIKYITSAKDMSVKLLAKKAGAEYAVCDYKKILQDSKVSLMLITTHHNTHACKAYSKERIEVHSQERTLILDNWKELKGYGFKGFSKMKGRQDKGHKAQFAFLNERIQKGGEALISFDSILNTTRASFACIESLKTKSWIDIQ